VTNKCVYGVDRTCEKTKLAMTMDNKTVNQSLTSNNKIMGNNPKIRCRNIYTVYTVAESAHVELVSGSVEHVHMSDDVESCQTRGVEQAYMVPIDLVSESF